MPPNNPHALLTSLQRQAARTLTTVQREISHREQELAALKAEAARWQAAWEKRTGKTDTTPTPAAVKAAHGSRLDWASILKKLPARFTSRDVARVTAKPMAQVHAGLTRWVKDNKVRKDRAGYQKLAPASAPTPKVMPGKGKVDPSR